MYKRQALTGILFVLKTGIPWEYLPKELGAGSGMTCWRRLRDWQAAGVWQKIWHALLDELGQADAIDWSAAAIDSCSVPAVWGWRKRARIPRIGARTARNATRSSTGTARRWPSSIRGPTSMTPRWPSRSSKPSSRSSIPAAARADARTRCTQTAGTTQKKIRKPLRRRGIVPGIAKRNTGHGSSLGTVRWVVEAASSWLFKQRRLRVRYEKRDDIHQAFLIIGCLLICWHRVSGFC